MDRKTLSLSIISTDDGVFVIEGGGVILVPRTLDELLGAAETIIRAGLAREKEVPPSGLEH